MIRRHSACKVSFVLGTTVEGRIDGHFLFSDDGHFDLGRTFLVSSTWSSTEHGRFTKGELKPAQEDGVEVISLDGRVDGYPIAWTIAGLATLNDKSNTILNDITSLWLGIDGPRRVKLVLVDDDLRGGRNDGGLVTSKEPSGNPG